MSKRRVYMSNKITPTVFYRTLKVEGLEIFYREAGPRDAPTVLLLHGFPSSSHMFRNLIPMLADKYHVVAPDFPGYGESSAPSVNDFDYSFERLATVLSFRHIQGSLGQRHDIYPQAWGSDCGTDEKTTESRSRAERWEHPGNRLRDRRFPAPPC